MYTSAPAEHEVAVWCDLTSYLSLNRYFFLSLSLLRLLLVIISAESAGAKPIDVRAWFVLRQLETAGCTDDCCTRYYYLLCIHTNDLQCEPRREQVDFFFFKPWDNFHYSFNLNHRWRDCLVNEYISQIIQILLDVWPSGIQLNRYWTIFKFCLFKVAYLL